MTIEVRQLVIRAVVDSGIGGESGRAAPGWPPPASPVLTPPGAQPAADTRAALVTACVQEVLRRLERRRDR